jgi:DDE superfamily endonuclease/Tc5 transposase DNA-binding domain/Fission yeast centromere protein N-terminal domain
LAGPEWPNLVCIRGFYANQSIFPFEMKRNTLTFGQKEEIRKHHAENKCTHEQLTVWATEHFGVAVGQSTIGKILKTKMESLVDPEQKRLRVSRFPELEAALFEFVIKYQEKTSITDLVITSKARKLCEEMGISEDKFKISNGWLNRFKQRHGIRLRTLHGESGSVNESELAGFRKQLIELIDDYEPRNVFNMDETGLFFRMQPSKSLGTKKLKGRKKAKERITVGLCVNMDASEKMEPIVIDQYQNPRCFKGESPTSCGVRYYANKKAWMDRAVFCDWLKSFNSKMHGRKVLLLIDNAPGHIALDLNNVRVEFLPKNTTAFLQPLDAGIINNFKVKYKSLFVQWLIDRLEADQHTRIDLMSAVLFVVEAWAMVTPNTIRNCWGATKIMSGAYLAHIHSENDPKTTKDELKELQTMITKLDVVDPVDAQAFVDESFVVTMEVTEASDGDDVSDESEDEMESQVPSHQQALACACDLRMYMLAQE